MPPHVVAGFMGNGQAESGFNPGPSGDGGNVHGMMQYDPQRTANFQRVTGVHPSVATPEQAAQFIQWEMNNPEQAGMTRAQRDSILNSPDAATAGRRIDQFYERSNGQTRGQRAANAQRYWDYWSRMAR